MTPDGIPRWICADTGRPHEWYLDVDYDPNRPPTVCEQCGEARHQGTIPPRLSPPGKTLLRLLIEVGPQDILTPLSDRTARALVRRGLAHWADPEIRIALHPGYVPRTSTPTESP